MLTSRTKRLVESFSNKRQPRLTNAKLVGHIISVSSKTTVNDDERTLRWSVISVLVVDDTI